MTTMNDQRNAIGDLFYSDKKHTEEMEKLQLLQNIADKDASTNTWVYVIPIAGLIIFGVLLAVVIKKKKKS